MADTIFTPAELNDGFVVAIEIDAKVGAEDAVGAARRALIEPTMAEPGVKLFLPYRSPRDPKAFFIFELYRSEAGWAQHQQTDHFKALVDSMLPPHREAGAYPIRPLRSKRVTNQLFRVCTEYRAIDAVLSGPARCMHRAR